MSPRPWDSVRKFPARNTGSVDIPPYGLVMLANEQGGYSVDWGHGAVVAGATRRFTKLNFYAAESPENSRRVRFFVARPEAHSDDELTRMQACSFAVNGPVTIPAGGIGEISQDWPLQVFHSGKYNVAPNGAACGAKGGSFGVWTPRGPFIILSHDPTDPIGDGLNHTVWIAPKGPTTQRIIWADQILNIPASQSFNLGDAIPLSLAQSVQQVNAVLSGTDNDTVNVDGLYLITFSGTIWSDDAPRATMLGISLDTKKPHESSWTSRAIAARYQNIEINQLGADAQIARENVSATIVVSLIKDDKIRFSSIASYGTYCNNAHFSIVRLGNAAFPATDIFGADAWNDDPEQEQFDDLGADPDPAIGLRSRATPSSGAGGGSLTVPDSCTFQWNGTSWDLLDAGTCGSSCAPPVDLPPGTPAGPIGYGACSDGGGEELP